ncbi:MAG: SLC13 family permease [Actinobacteria bacterium]|nr:SLC13 family permease [Actinomycetota bacterium]
MADSTISFLVLGAVVVLFVWNRIPVELVAIGAGLALYATGVLELDQVLAGYGDATVVLIASLFVVSEGLDATGVTTWAGQEMIARAGTDRSRLLVYVMLLVAVLTALVSVNGAVAALLPMVVVVAVRLGRSPSQLVMPLAFAAHAGSMLALTGTPVNVIVSDAAVDAGGSRFGYLSFALVGIPLLVGVIAIAVVLGPRLLPERHARVIPPDLSAHARTLVRQYLDAESVARMLVGEGSTLVGRRQAELALADHPRVAIVGIAHGSDPVVEGDAIGQVQVEVGDFLLVRGDDDAIAALAADHGLHLQAPAARGDEGRRLLNRGAGVGEVVVAPRSELIGQSVFPGMVTDSGDFVVLAVQRRGDDLGPDPVTLAAGDTLLLQGTWAALDRTLDSREVLVVDRPDLVRRQAVPMGPGARRAAAVLAAMVVLLITGAVPTVVAGLLAAGAMVLLRVLTVDQAYRGISWTTVVLVGGMIPLSTAITQSGAADTLANGLVDLVGDHGPYALLLGLFVLTAVLGQLISNMATALIVIPIALSAAAELAVSPRPVLMSVTVAAAASFLTPVATPANLMVMDPGGYRFGDYWKLGLPMLLWFGVVSVLLVPQIWSF